MREMNIILFCVHYDKKKSITTETNFALFQVIVF